MVIGQTFNRVAFFNRYVRAANERMKLQAFARDGAPSTIPQVDGNTILSSSVMEFVAIAVYTVADWGNWVRESAIDLMISPLNWMWPYSEFYLHITDGESTEGYPRHVPAEFEDFDSLSYTCGAAFVGGEYARCLADGLVYQYLYGEWCLSEYPQSIPPTLKVLYGYPRVGDVFTTYLFNAIERMWPITLKWVSSEGGSSWFAPRARWIGGETGDGEMRGEVTLAWPNPGDPSTWAAAKSPWDAFWASMATTEPNAEPRSLSTGTRLDWGFPPSPLYLAEQEVTQGKYHVHLTGAEVIGDLTGEYHYTFYGWLAAPDWGGDWDGVWDAASPYTEDYWEELGEWVGPGTGRILSDLIGDVEAQPAWCDEPTVDRRKVKGWEMTGCVLLIDASAVFEF